MPTTSLLLGEEGLGAKVHAALARTRSKLKLAVGLSGIFVWTE